jgi:phosphoglycolate phosphatase-like HAD superfamily hydrolase
MHHLIFDFDGVIGDTLMASAEATAAIEGTDVFSARAANARYARNKPNHVRNHTLSEAEMNGLLSWTSAFGERMLASAFPLFDDFVREIESINTPHKAVVSSGSQKYVVPSLSRTKIAPTHILAFEDHHSKEEKIESICRDWNVAVNDVFYFTDTLADVYELSGMLAKEKLIGVSWGYCTREELAQVLEERYILKTPKDIHNVLAYA